MLAVSWGSRRGLNCMLTLWLILDGLMPSTTEQHPSRWHLGLRLVVRIGLVSLCLLLAGGQDLGVQRVF